MTPYDFWKKFGSAKTREVCGLAGTTFAYFEQIKRGNKKPSADLATAISNAARELTGVAIDPASMREAKGVAASKREALRQARAQAFAASQARAA